jgi:biopolymer transport protein TolR
MAFKPGLDDDLGPVADINVTPLVDVMLVLLIIFMITAPLMTQGLTVELPTAEGRNLETSSASPTTITIGRSGEVAVDGTSVGSGDQLETNLTSMLRSRKVSKALLEADASVSYGDVIRVIDIMNRAGVEQLGMVTRPPESSDAGRRR